MITKHMSKVEDPAIGWQFLLHMKVLGDLKGAVTRERWRKPLPLAPGRNEHHQRWQRKCGAVMGAGFSREYLENLS